VPVEGSASAAARLLDTETSARFDLICRSLQMSIRLLSVLAQQEN
jgi:hypothetical protein